jgi:CheY-like chemotaxis protein
LPVPPITVLVVDDDPGIRTIMSRTMEAAGYSVYAAADGLEALAMLGHAPFIDVVVTDVRMPRMDGRALAAELAQAYPHIPVLFVSGYDAHLGPTDLLGPVLPKPFRTETLIETVRGVLGRHQRSA